jgi:excisionase family DNA binding protein
MSSEELHMIANGVYCSRQPEFDHMEKTDDAGKQKWYSIAEAAEYLDVGEPTIYRWMREDKITFRKVGDSTRFWREDLDSVMEVFHSGKDLEKVKRVCPICHHDELVEGKVRGAGLVYFVPKKTKFWTLKDSFVQTTSFMCLRCGAISWFGDTAKMVALQAKTKPAATSIPPQPPE